MKNYFIFLFVVVGLNNLSAQNFVDSTFGTYGIVNIPFAGALIYSLVLQTDFKMIIAGETYPDFIIGRLNEDASIDSTFNSIGFTSIDSLERNSAVKLQSDGKIICLNDYYTNSTSKGIAVLRFNTDGLLDTLFGNQGISKFSFDTLNSYTFNGLVIQPDSMILISGFVYHGFSNATDAIIFRYKPNGNLDSSFGSNGVVILDHDSLDGSSYSNSICLQTDRKIIVSGDDIFRLNYDGFVDSTFGNAGFIHFGGNFGGLCS